MHPMANKKLLGRTKPVKLSQPANRRHHDGDDAQTNIPSSTKSRRQRSLTPDANRSLSRLESPIDPALLSQTAKISFHKSHSAISLHTIRPKTAGDTTGERDWKSMLSTGSPIEVKTGHDIFSFPTPVKRPSTANSSFIASPRMGGTSKTVNMSQDSGIGMALGSPSDFTYFNSNWGGEVEQEEDVRVFPAPVRANTTRETGEDRSHPKINRWKSIGGLFARKPSARAASRNGSYRSGRSAASPVIDERGGSSFSNRTRGDSTGSSSNQSDAPVPGLWRRATRRKPKPRAWTEPNLRNVGSPIPPPKDSLLEVQIPETTMERYSVMFQSIQGLPTRSASLLTRRQGAGDQMEARHLAELQINPGMLIRRATEPSPASPSYKLFPRSSGETERSIERLPHISKAMRRNPPHLSTLHRPRPIKRTNTSPSTLRSPLSLNTANIKQHRLSPALETDELHPPKISADDSDNEGLTPTPSTPASPTTPKSFSPSPPVRKNSWASSNGQDEAWGTITIKKRYSPGDLFSASTTNLVAAINSADEQASMPSPPPPPPPTRAAPPAPARINTKVAADFSEPSNSEQMSALSPFSGDEEDDWICDAPQVVIARSVSVTRANSHRKLMVRPIRSTSRVNKAPALTIASPSSSAPSFQSSATTSASIVISPSSSVTSRSSTPTSTDAKGDDRDARIQTKKLDLRREIWGETRAKEAQHEKWVENQSLTPNLCIVEEDPRKSVWGMIETA